MSRDIRFEIEYLLSLTVAVLGFLSINEIRQSIDVSLGYLFLLLISIHLILFNVYYIFDVVAEIKPNRIASVRNVSKWSLYFIAAFFSYLIAHIIFSFLYKNLNVCQSNGDVITVILFTLSCDSTNLAMLSAKSARIFMLYGLPVLIVLAFMSPLLAVIPSFRLFDEIDVVISPTELEITDNFDDTVEVSITILNNGSKHRDLSLSIEPSSDIVMREKGGDEINAIQGREFTLSGDYGAEKIRLETRYEGAERRPGYIDVTLKHRFTSKSKKVDVELYP